MKIKYLISINLIIKVNKKTKIILNIYKNDLKY